MLSEHDIKFCKEYHGVFHTSFHPNSGIRCQLELQYVGGVSLTEHFLSVQYMKHVVRVSDVNENKPSVLVNK